jgi:hypothetical protein
VVTPEIWIFIIGSLLTVFGSWLAARVAGKSSEKVAKVAADEGAYLRAEKIYESAIARLEAENKELRARVRTLEQRVRELERNTLPEEDI